MVNCDTKTQVVDVLCSSPKPCTTQHQTPNFSAMDNLRKLIVMELSTLNPSKLVENRLHSHVESQLQALIDDLPTPTHPPYASVIDFSLIFLLPVRLLAFDFVSCLAFCCFCAEKRVIAHAIFVIFEFSILNFDFGIFFVEF